MAKRGLTRGSGVTPGKAFKGDEYIEKHRQSDRTGNFKTPNPHGSRGKQIGHKTSADRGNAFKGDEYIERHRQSDRTGNFKKPNPHGSRGKQIGNKTSADNNNAFKGDENIETTKLQGIRTAKDLNKKNTTPSIKEKYDISPQIKITSLAHKTSEKAEDGTTMSQGAMGTGWNPYTDTYIDRKVDEKGNVSTEEKLLFPKKQWDALRRDELNMFGKNLKISKKFYRFGYINPEDAIGNTREYLFFTRPDLHIMDNNKLNEELQGIAFWEEMVDKRMDIVKCLNHSAAFGSSSKMNYLLSNQVSSSLDVPSNEATLSETAANIYGVSLTYRGSSESSDDNFDFSLEFKDNRNLDVFYFFKAYEEYETMKHHGTVTPYHRYIQDKILHDQFAIYKFVLDEDMVTILYYCKYYGVMPKNMPRDVFSNVNFENGITYTVNFHAQFFEDADPRILSDFNAWQSGYSMGIALKGEEYTDIFTRENIGPDKANGQRDNRAVDSALVYKNKNDGKYKLYFKKNLDINNLENKDELGTDDEDYE